MGGWGCPGGLGMERQVRGQNDFCLSLILSACRPRWMWSVDPAQDPSQAPCLPSALGRACLLALSCCCCRCRLGLFCPPPAAQPSRCLRGCLKGSQCLFSAVSCVRGRRGCSACSFPTQRPRQWPEGRLAAHAAGPALGAPFLPQDPLEVAHKGKSCSKKKAMMLVEQGGRLCCLVFCLTCASMGTVCIHKEPTTPSQASSGCRHFHWALEAVQRPQRSRVTGRTQMAAESPSQPVV